MAPGTIRPVSCWLQRTTASAAISWARRPSRELRPTANAANTAAASGQRQTGSHSASASHHATAAGTAGWTSQRANRVPSTQRTTLSRSSARGRSIRTSRKPRPTARSPATTARRNTGTWSRRNRNAAPA